LPFDTGPLPWYGTRVRAKGATPGWPVRSLERIMAMDKFTLTLLGTLLAFLSALCLDSSGLQGVWRSPIAPRAEVTEDGSPRNPVQAVLGLALLAASALTGVLASLTP